MDGIEMPKMSEILREFMEPLGISAKRLADDIGVLASRVLGILRNRKKVTAETSIRLGRYFGVSERYFIDLQNDIDIRNAKILMGEELAKIRPVTDR